MASKDSANKENDGPTPSKDKKNVIVFATDVALEQREQIISIAQKAFHTPVTSGKVYETIAGMIRTECEKEFSEDGTGKSSGSGGWSCVVGDAFGSSVTHRMKTYVHFSVVKGVNVLIWKS